MKKYLLIVTELSLCLGLGCAPAPHRSTQMKEQLLELRSEFSTQGSNQLVGGGEKALQIFDEAGYLQAQALADDGYAQLSLEAFDEALMFFEMALKKDRGNERALFYLSYFRPLRPLKGILWRVSQGNEMSALDRARLEQSYDWTGHLEISIFKYFVYPFGEQITSPAQAVQEVVDPFLDELRASSDDFEILLTNPKLDLEIHMPESFRAFRDIRLRNADVRAVKAMYQILYIELRLLSAYRLSNLNQKTREGMPAEARIRYDQKDPALATLKDPHVFKMIQQDALSFIEDLDQVERDLMFRFTQFENDGRDLFQINRMKLQSCRMRSVFASPIEHCAWTEEIVTPFVFTSRQSQERTFFERLVEGQLVTQEEDLAQLKKLEEEERQKIELRKNLSKLRALVLGPVEEEFHCWNVKEEWVTEKIWINFHRFAENPIRDLKKTLKPKFIKGTEDIDAIYELKDPTVGGLFSPHYPCYQHNRQRARMKGGL